MDKITSAEVHYVADEEQVQLILKKDDSAPFWRFLTIEAYQQLRLSILNMECEICGGNHPDPFHGAVITVMDTQRAPAWQELGDQIGHCENLLDNDSERLWHSKMWGLLNEYKAVIRPVGGEDELDYDHFDNKMSEIMSDAGYVIVNNSDSAAWMIYAAYEDVPQYPTPEDTM